MFYLSKRIKSEMSKRLCSNEAINCSCIQKYIILHPHFVESYVVTNNQYEQLYKLSIGHHNVFSTFDILVMDHTSKF